MKKLLFLLFFTSTLGFACEEHPTTDGKTPLWVKYLVKAASDKKPQDHKAHKHEAKDRKKPSPSKKLK